MTLENTAALGLAAIPEMIVPVSLARRSRPKAAPLTPPHRAPRDRAYKVTDGVGVYVGRDVGEEQIRSS